MIQTVILDFETSGLNQYHDDIIEIGAKVFNGDNKFSVLLRPKSNEMISPEITSLPNYIVSSPDPSSMVLPNSISYPSKSASC